MVDEQEKRKPGRPKGSSTAQTMEKILFTASYQFMELGFEKVSLDGVAKASGVTKASVYYYFNNKAVLFTEAILFVLNIAYQQTRKIITGSGELKDRLLIVAERHMANAHVDFETMMREAAPGLTEEQTLTIRAGEARLHELLAGIFQEAMDKKELVSGNPLLLAHAYTAMLSIRNRKKVVNDEASLKQTARELVELFWHGAAPH
ncbi:hypothetical protein BBD42_26085 [Paenibacillus sp. BIHB 4019]|uniref:HTH tetR-type domain-containing protein n=1 Tax=Paenibacillus sp. BIHB 4019 TaxID=1870819 RepID=A0A1B2DPD9_9BACL|nr:TetR/AcrR family transcriptional regulator [Paenibacillus sp. BIHB 4019]ANY69571.1 hypothetical protein BBD42_26085 [Paenibacillus sp. BIHB 4019]